MNQCMSPFVMEQAAKARRQRKGWRQRTTVGITLSV